MPTSPQRVEADLALKRVNETLEQRVKSRTAELTRVNEELAQAQMFAEEANLGKTTLRSRAGHDILQPLNAARLYCSSLIEKARPGPDRRSRRRTSNPRWNRSRPSSAPCSTSRASTPAR